MPPRKVVNVQFTIFDLRSGNSSRCSGGALELINGDSAQAPLVGRYCDMVSRVINFVYAHHIDLWNLRFIYEILFIAKIYPEVHLGDSVAVISI